MPRERVVRSVDDGKISFFGIFRRTLRFILGVFLMIFLSWIVAIGIELFGLAFFWPDEGSIRSARVLAKEIGYLGGESASLQAKEQVLADAGYLYQLLVIRTGMSPFLEAASESAKAVKNVTLVLLVRLSILKTIIVLYAFATLWAFNEGLLFRAKRRWSGAVERSSLFHHSKLFLTVTVVLPVPLYLALNFAVHPLVVTGPFLALWMILIVCTVGLYKKFL